MDLAQALNKFKEETSFVPVMGAELEFYLGDENKEISENKILEFLQSKDIGVYECEREKGDRQFEVKFGRSDDLLKLTRDIEQVRDLLKEDYGACFDAKPFDDQPGSSLHLHISLRDDEGNNPFAKDGDEESEVTLMAIGGLLEFMSDSMKYFAPNKDSYKRFINDFESPQTISWGGNNRTVALRLPTTTHDNENRRVEHRVPGADAAIEQSIVCVLRGVGYGVLNKIFPKVEICYGDAGLQEYGFVRLI